MQAGVLTVGTDAVQVPVVVTGGNALRTQANNGLRLLARDANSGATYVGTTSGVTTDTGNLLPQGAPGVVTPYTVPADHFNAGGSIYLVADAADQVVDWSFD